MANQQPPVPAPTGRLDFQAKMGISSMIAQEYVGKQMAKADHDDFKKIVKNGFMLAGIYVEALDKLGTRLYLEEIAFQEKMVDRAKADEPQIVVPFPGMAPGPHGKGPA